jgi:hypothetical protein
MSFENLMRLQAAAQLISVACLFGGLAYLFAGLIRPGWVGLSRRIWVPFCTLGIWLLGIVIYGGAIGYTHSQPNGPHSFESYMDGWTAQICVREPTRAGCAELKKKCAEGDPTHPACRILAGEDPKKFFEVKIRQ